MRRHALVLAAAAALLASGCLGPAAPSPPASVHYAGLKIETRLGTFTVILYGLQTPLTTTFIEKLVESKYYDGRQFGRTIPGFVIQEVDRTGGTTDQKEHVKLEAGADIKFSAGALGIARDADPDSGGSEFFVMDHPSSALDGNYTAFAQVIDGMRVVHDIARQAAVRTGPASAAGSPSFSPVYFGVHDRVPIDPVVMTRVTRLDVTLDQATAARYPLRIGDSITTSAYRATLQWPADLRAGASSELAWFVAPRDASPTSSAQDPPPFDFRGVTATADGAPLPVTIDAGDGQVNLTWTPAAPGAHALALLRDGTPLATTNVTVG